MSKLPATFSARLNPDTGALAWFFAFPIVPPDTTVQVNGIAFRKVSGPQDLVGRKREINKDNNDVLDHPVFVGESLRQLIWLRIAFREYDVQARTMHIRAWGKYRDSFFRRPVFDQECDLSFEGVWVISKNREDIERSIEKYCGGCLGSTVWETVPAGNMATVFPEGS